MRIYKITFQSNFEQVDGNFLVLAETREKAIKQTEVWLTTLDKATFNYFVGLKDPIVIDAYEYPVNEQGVLIT